MKRSVHRTAFFSSCLALVLTSCGPSLSDITTDLIDQGRNDEAIARMKRALVLTPDKPEYTKLMAIAHYNKKQYDETVQLLLQVLKMDDEDDQAAYYLAASYEAKQDFNKAIQYYRIYNELTFFGEYKEVVEARIKLLYRQQMELEAQRALQMEQQLDVAKIPSNTIAILYFENKGKKTELDPLQKGLSEMLVTDLSKVKSLKVLERIRLQELVQEMNLSEMDIVDQKTAPRLGKLLGANRLVKGSFFELTGDKINIDAFVAKSRTGEIDATTNISGSVQDFFRMEKDLVFKIIDQMKIKLTDEEREAILEIPTENFFAFLQYSRGLDYEDRGLYTQAFEAYSQAAATDPNFSQAKTSASAAKKAEQIVGPTTTSSNSDTKSGEASQTDQKSSDTKQSNQSSSSSKSSTTASKSASANVLPPPASSPSGSGGTPGGGSGPGGIVTDRITSSLSGINNTVNPGTNSQNTPPPSVIEPLSAPPSPPK
ncbi:MAG: tetratricopeptide repeat protein [Bacteroidetes bacterium]|nr:tetratricopeptide repeat protein [Bacteroidota bacterium]